MAADQSISEWIVQLKDGEQEAAQRLWDRYFHQLAELASKKLRNMPRSVADEEDVALSALASFCRKAERGGFPSVADRNDLWGLLICMTCQKAVDLIRQQTARKRGNGKAAVTDLEDLKSLVAQGPSPATLQQMEEEYERRLAQLEDPELQSIARLKMEGYSNDEIAAKLKCVPRTIERRLKVIRAVWSPEISP